MFETYVGEENWQRGVHVYLTEHARGRCDDGGVHRDDRQDDRASRTGGGVRRLHRPAGHSGDEGDSGVRGGAGALNFGAERLCGRSGCRAGAADLARAGVRDGWDQSDVPDERRRRGVGAGEHSLHRRCRLPNAGGTGYYRFALDEAGWKTAIVGAATLGSAEQVAPDGQYVCGIEQRAGARRRRPDAGAGAGAGGSAMGCAQKPATAADRIPHAAGVGRSAQVSSLRRQGVRAGG